MRSLVSIAVFLLTADGALAQSCTPDLRARQEVAMGRIVNWSRVTLTAHDWGEKTSNQSYCSGLAALRDLVPIYDQYTRYCGTDRETDWHLGRLKQLLYQRMADVQRCQAAGWLK